MNRENPRGIWEEFPGQESSTLALPDYYSNYFDYSFERKGAARYTGLHITGEFAHARYMSFNVYDGDEGASYGALTDYQISPLPNNVNPFVAGSDAEAKNRSYSITVVPERYSTDGLENEVTFDGAIKVLTVMIRYYVPHGDDYGNVKLPTIKAFDARTGKRVALPQAYPLRGSMPKVIMRGRLALIFKTEADDDTLRFYHAGGSGQFNNADSSYLISAISHGEGQVLLVRVKPPSYPTNNDEFDKTDVRYWSFNEGDANTSTPFGMKDVEFRRAKDGFVHIAIGDESIRRTAKKRGYNFMPWEAHRRKSVILYRNLVTNPQYRGNFDKVPEIEPKDLRDKQTLYSKDAKNYIGDYAPTGKKISQALFMLGSSGTASPGF